MIELGKLALVVLAVVAAAFLECVFEFLPFLGDRLPLLLD